VSVAIIDYGSGNLHSVAKAFERANAEAGLSISIIVTSDPDQVRRAERIVLPGVGAFKDCRSGLGAVHGMIEALSEKVQKQGAPFFGICVGMQLMATRGLEHGETKGLGWIRGDVAALSSSDPSLKIPHMGWNTLEQRHVHPVLHDIPLGKDGLHAYFVHSYAMMPLDPKDRLADTDYGGSVTAMIARDNMVGTQFHPEKSQKLGLAVITNFLRWNP
jgi:imidazole glycerol-phosphate synthase subunit HisH